MIPSSKKSHLAARIVDSSFYEVKENVFYFDGCRQVFLPNRGRFTKGDVSSF